MKKSKKILISLIMFFVVSLTVGITKTSVEVFASNNFSNFAEVEDVTNYIFGEKEIQSIEYLYGFNDSPDYIYVDFADYGYAVYFSETMELMEYSPIGELPYENKSEQKYYAGPSNYFAKKDDRFVNAVTGDDLHLTKDEAGAYSRQIASCFSVGDTQQQSSLINTNQEYENNFIENKSPEIDKENLIVADPPGATGTTYIPNAEYFAANPTHGYNLHGTCGSVAAQILLGYNNYYNDRRIIAPQHLNGEWNNSTGNNDIYDPANYRNRDFNPNVCIDPMKINYQTAGTNYDFYNYVISSIEPTALECTCTTTETIISGDTAYVTVTIHYPDGTSKTTKSTRPAEPGERGSRDTDHTHEGSSINDVKNGLESILNSRIANDQYTINADQKLLRAIDSAPIKAEIDAGRPLIISTSSRLGGDDHWVVGYGYQDYTYPTGHDYEGKTYSGYVVHYGWIDDIRIWVNKAWCSGYISLQLNHSHDYSIDTNINIYTGKRELRCAGCGHRTVDDLFTFNTSGDTITGFNYDLTGEINIPSVINDNTITGIGDYAFANQTGITSINLPNTITTIGDSAFSGCSNLISIDIKQSVTSIGECAFYGCASLKSIILPGNVTSIGKSTFNGCAKLERIALSNSLTSIGGYAFNGCAKLDNITLPNSLTSIGESAFRDCTSLQEINILESVTSIGNKAFGGCSNLRTVYWNATNCTKAGYERMLVFDGCESLTFVIISENVETIPAYAFSYCSNIKSIEIPDSVTTIGDYAFSCCSGLAKVEIHASVENMGRSVFLGCDGLKSAMVNNKIIWDYAFCGCDNLTDVTLGGNVTTIKSYAFANCDSLESITVPENVKDIGEYIFSGCNNLQLIDFKADNCNDFIANGDPFEDIDSKSLTINFDCNKVPDYIAFWNNGIAEVRLGDKVRSIGQNSFHRCGMIKVYISEGVEGICEGVFGDCNNLVNIEVSPNNSTYFSENNCLIRKSDSTLIAACNTSVIPSCVKNIAKNAFVELNMTSLTIPNTVTHIEAGAFRTMRLKNISLPIEGDGSPAWQSFASLFGDDREYMPSGMSVSITNGSTIHESAFYGSSFVSTINLPETIEALGANAFAYCGLREINLPNTIEVLSDKVFLSCSGLREINLPNNLREIHGAFSGCRNLEMLRIPASVTLIKGNAFQYCDGLYFIELQRTAAQGITVIEKGTFGRLTNNTFANSKLKGITVNDKDSYDMYVNQFLANGEPILADFVTFKELKFKLLDDESYSVTRGRIFLQGTIEIPAYHDGKPVTVIEQNAFKGCEFIESIKIPETVMVIKSGAFDDCENLRTLQIQRHNSSGIVDLSADIFGETHIWGNIILQDEATYLAYVSAYPKYEDLFIYYEGNLNYELKSDGTYKITGKAAVNEEESDVLFIPSYYNGKPITEIGNEAFMDRSFRSVIFMGGSKIQTIGNKAFYNCTELYCIEIPISVQYIGDQAFAGTDLKSITLRSGIEVGTSAFASSVTVYTDAAVVPENWSFVDGHYIFYDCELSEAANYVETICVQERNGYEGALYDPYRQLHSGTMWGANPVAPYFLTDYSELVSYTLKEIIDGAVPCGTIIYAIMGYAVTI